MNIRIRDRRYTEAEALASAYVPGVGESVWVKMPNGDLRKYMGDGVQVIADMVVATNHLISRSAMEAAVQAEQARATAAEAALAADITTLEGTVNGQATDVSQLQADLAQEVIDRQQGDTTETAARIAADNAEASTRAAADTAEANTRAADDATEAAARIAGDAATLAAANAHADGLMVGMFDDRGNYDASGNVWPSSGGSGTAGAVLKGDVWRISVAGTLGGNAVDVGDSIRALTDAPGQTASNWGTFEHNVQQATEGVRGTAAIATNDEVADELTTNDIDIVTPAKWWRAWLHGLGLATFKTAVLGLQLTGYAIGSPVDIAATDTILAAFGKLQAALKDHVNNTSNPHNTTKAQVGLSNVPNTDATQRANHTGTQSADTLTDGTTNKAFLATERTKLAGIATGATANSTDAYLLDRTNHTSTQTASTISNFADTVRTTVLTGLSLATSQVVAATDTIREAIGYLQAQVTALGTSKANVVVINVYTTPGSNTWNKPAGAKAVHVHMLGGGAGGSSGRKSATGVAASGGAGGGAGAEGYVTIDASVVGSSETVTVGAGGAGGASVTGNSANGLAGTAGGQSSFGAHIRAGGGVGGQAASTASASAGSGSAVGRCIGQTGAAGATTVGTAPVTNIFGFSPGAGGAGGGITAGNAASNGGNGGNGSLFKTSANAGGTGGVSGGSSPTNGNAGTANKVEGGGGGAGGASSTSTNAQAGSNGGLYGAGGGGGGAARDSVGNSGAGGNGADGIVVVFTHF